MTGLSRESMMMSPMRWSELGMARALYAATLTNGLSSSWRLCLVRGASAFSK